MLFLFGRLGEEMKFAEENQKNSLNILLENTFQIQNLLEQIIGLTFKLSGTF